MVRKVELSPFEPIMGHSPGTGSLPPVVGRIIPTPPHQNMSMTQSLETCDYVT